jgi:hypothetical protein
MFQLREYHVDQVEKPIGQGPMSSMQIMRSICDTLIYAENKFPFRSGSTCIVVAIVNNMPTSMGFLKRPPADVTSLVLNADSITDAIENQRHLHCSSGPPTYFAALHGSM